MTTAILPTGPTPTPYQLNWGEAGIVQSGTVISYTDYWTAIYAIDAPSVQIDGAVFSYGDGYRYTGSETASLIVGATGSIVANEAVTATAGNLMHIMNAGTLNGRLNGVSLSGTLADETTLAPLTVWLNNSGDIFGVEGVGFHAIASIASVRITNTGTLSGPNSGVCIEGDTATNLRLVNRGSIVGAVETSLLSFGDDDGSGRDQVTNLGTIDGRVMLNQGHDTIVNAGSILGNIEAGSGWDLIDNRAGLVTGRILAAEGNDTIRASLVHGDSVWGGDGDDLLLGGDADDFLQGDWGNDRLHGDAGNDTLSGSAGNDRLDGGAGSDVTADGDGDDLHLGREGDDTLSGGEGNDTLNGGLGDDELQLGGGNDRGIGAEGDDRLVGGDGLDALSGGAGTDVLAGGAGNDALWGGTDNDTLSGDADDDRLSGEDGDDVLRGGDGNDIIAGGSGNDRLLGDDGNDRLVAGAGNDVLQGGADDDELWGDAGADLMTGGAGADRFVFARGMGRDVITDFSAADGDSLVFTGIASRAGSLQYAHQVGAATLFDFGAGDMLVLQNVNLAALTDLWT